MSSTFPAFFPFFIPKQEPCIFPLYIPGIYVYPFFMTTTNKLRCPSCGRLISRWDFRCPRCRWWSWTKQTVTIYIILAALLVAGATIKP
jgi:hypothetical protein